MTPDDLFEDEELLFNTYFLTLEKNFKKYNGQYKEIVRVVPDMFKFLINLHGDPSLPESGKPLINAAIAYLVSPKDVVPEGDLGLYAFIDDMFLCAWAVKKLSDNMEFKKIERNWEGSGEFEKVLNETFDLSGRLVGNLQSKIIKHAGLRSYG